MQAATQAVADTHRLLVAEKYFENTSTSIREPSNRPTTTEEGSLRRAYNAGIKRSSAVLKQIDTCLQTLEALEDFDKNKGKGNGVGSGSSSGGSSNKSNKGSTVQQEATSSHPPRRKHKITTRPPHMDRKPSVDELVAAKVASHELWILGVVQSFDERNKMYQVKDADADGRSYNLSLANIRLLPNKNEVNTCRWIVPGLTVLAMYPATTSFYPATVRKESSQEEGEGSAVVVFEDDEDDLGELPEKTIPKIFITLRN